jgi:hypothetical protein
MSESKRFIGFADLVDTPEEGRAVVADLDRVAERRGFVSRQAPEVAIKRQRGTDDTIHQFTMRVRVKASNEFVRYCEKNRLSYREGFDLLVSRLEP